LGTQGNAGFRIDSYSIGADDKYRGDALDDLSKFDPDQVRSEFRLWDVSRRGQASLKP